MRENFISRAEDEESNAKVNPIDNNKTLIIDQYTNDVAMGDPELLEKAKTIKDVLDHFKPKAEAEFLDEDGGSVNEVLHFKEMSDFEANGGKGNLVVNSTFLSNIKAKVDINAKLRKQIEQNKKLRDIMKDKQAKEELKAVLEALLEELKNY
ncbi:MAG TPA: hypothetical protein PKW80_10500 [Bacteroidales bacterium]|nr:hypothetical protein [Bacteroidales bacterium]